MRLVLIAEWNCDVLQLISHTLLTLKLLVGKEISNTSAKM